MEIPNRQHIEGKEDIMKINIVTVGVNESHVSDVIKQVKDIEEKHNVDCTITVNIPYRRPYSTEMVLP
jgi:hypothetical protein